MIVLLPKFYSGINILNARRLTHYSRNYAGIFRLRLVDLGESVWYLHSIVIMISPGL